jgi:hypothetical protein
MEADKDAGRRWIAEIVFSVTKRIVGEDLLNFLHRK